MILGSTAALEVHAECWYVLRSDNTEDGYGMGFWSWYGYPEGEGSGGGYHKGYSNIETPVFRLTSTFDSL